MHLSFEAYWQLHVLGLYRVFEILFFVLLIRSAYFSIKSDRIKYIKMNCNLNLKKWFFFFTNKKGAAIPADLPVSATHWFCFFVLVLQAKLNINEKFPIFLSICYILWILIIIRFETALFTSWIRFMILLRSN